MSLSALEISDRVERLLESRMRSSGQLNGLDDEQLDGIGKALKKVAKKVGKVVKKVAPIALGAGALYLGAKVIGGAIKGKPKAAAAASVAAPVAAAALQQAVSSGALAPQPTAGTQLIDTAGQVATALISAQGLPSAAGDPGMQQIIRDSVAAEMQNTQYAQQQYASSGGSYMPSSSAPRQSSAFEQDLPEMTVTADRLKPYLVPGAIGAGLLVLMLLMNQNKRKG